MKPKILLVEDEEENQLLGLTLLKTLDVEVFLAKNGAEALLMAHEKQPNLILLDIIMPVMTGLEVLEKLKADPKTKDLDVIMLTSRQLIEEFRKAQKLGVKGFLNKPYDNDDFLSRVCMQLGIPMPTRK